MGSENWKRLQLSKLNVYLNNYKKKGLNVYNVGCVIVYLVDLTQYGII